MLQCCPADGVLYQAQIASELSYRFGEEAIYGIQNGNLAIFKERMTNGREQPGKPRPEAGGESMLRRRLGLKGEFRLVLFPTLIVLVVLALVDVLTRQRLLFASLASGAFLIYLEPLHRMNTVRSLVIAQTLVAVIGLLTALGLGHGYLAAASAMVGMIVVMILLDVVHPPAVGTAISFAFRVGAESNLVLFGLALGIMVVLVILEQVMVWQLAGWDTSGEPAPRAR